MEEVTSKHFDGIADLVVVAPIKPGFIKAFEAITYGTRLKLVAEALNRVRISAREHERIQPFTDVTERILNLLDFRIGVLDKDMFGLAKNKSADGALEDTGLHLEPRRYLYLTATFEGGWEPYMRLIWEPLGAFLDLLFCNCEGYVTASEHSCEEYLQWVRDNQMDSAIFYNTTGLTTRDQKYLSRLERLQRDGPDDLDPDLDLKLATLTMPYPDDEARAARLEHGPKTVELALEALTVLYKLADYYPPEWMTGAIAELPEPGEPDEPGEGHRLVRVAREILRGFDDVLKVLDMLADLLAAGQQVPPAYAPYETSAKRWMLARKIYAEPLEWYKTGRTELARLGQVAAVAVVPDPDFVRSEVQAGILKASGSASDPVRSGALLMFTVRDAEGARRFIAQMLETGQISFEAEADAALYATIAFTAQGLLQLGLERSVHDCLPKEFREGPARRSGLVGDMRENHPRNWRLPPRNGPIFTGAIPAGTHLPPVDLDEVDFVIQLRSTAADQAAVEAEVRRLAALAGAAATLEAIDWLHIKYDGGDFFEDHFGYRDGLSQPKPSVPDEALDPAVPARNRVKLGEVLLGYANDRGDAAPGLFDDLDGVGEATHWRQDHRAKARALQKDGSFLVIRKIGEDVAAFDGWLDAQAGPVATQLGCNNAAARALLKAAVMGRDATGAPLAKPDAPRGNDFDYQGDQQGLRCPHAAHIRRANPRRTIVGDGVAAELRAEFSRPTPRLVRRGMLFGGAADASPGLMFMAYNASIAEQYETIQRWLNGGNSTDVAAANNDPLTGVLPRGEQDTFRFVAQKAGLNGPENVVVRVKLPLAHTPENRGDEPGRHPFTPLYWGMYLLVPSRTALRAMTELRGSYRALEDPLEMVVGAAWLKRLGTLSPQEAGHEWKRLLEDFDTKDPAQEGISPNLWAAIRLYLGGAINLRGVRNRQAGPLPQPAVAPDQPAGASWQVEKIVAEILAQENSTKDSEYDWEKPKIETQNVIICAGQRQVLQVLSNWNDFTSEEQLRRIMPHAGPIYVTQQPDDDYEKLDPTYKGTALNYHQESFATNTALFEYPEDAAFEAGYNAGRHVLQAAKAAVARSNSIDPAGQRNYFKIELRRQYIQPAIAEVWKTWYGLPDGETMFEGAWSWKRVVTEISEADPATVARTGALCPGDFMAPSRGSVFPRPSPSVEYYSQKHGAAILAAGRKFVTRLKHDPTLVKTKLAAQLLAAAPDNDEVLARNLIGTMIGAIPPMDANLRNIILEWLLEKNLWRHQSAMQRVLAGAAVKDKVSEVREVLRGPISRAMCKRPAPDLLFRTAKGKAKIERGASEAASTHWQAVETQEGDLIVTSLASVSQRTFHDHPDGDVSVIFGGKRSKVPQGYIYEGGQVRHDTHASIDEPVHACPAQKMAMGAMTGILAALLEAGTIHALPASLIVKISDWEGLPPGP